MQIFDSHCHFDDDVYDADRGKCLERANAAGVVRILNPGYDLASSRRAIDLAIKHDGIWAAVGIHPQEGDEHRAECYKKLEEMVLLDKVVAIGEVGLDYYWMKSPKEAQHEAFLWQIGLAERYSLPLIVHSRDASQETFQIVKANRHRMPGLVMHCFSGSAEMALEYVKMGCMISLAGPLTFSNARKAHEVAAKVPLSHLMSETDGPYLTPMPLRGKRNEPSYTKFVVEKMAELKGLPVEEVAERTSENAKRLFRIA